jgi:hypothetical protein
MAAQDFSFAQELLKEVAKWCIPLLGAVVAVYFTPLVERLKLGINRANLRTQQYEEFAADVSHFIYHAELVHLYFVRGWTEPKDLDPVIDDYNVSIACVRKKEFVYLSWAYRYWKKEEWKSFDTVLSLIKAVDDAIHQLFVQPPNPSLTQQLERNHLHLVIATRRLLLPHQGTVTPTERTHE